MDMWNISIFCLINSGAVNILLHHFCIFVRISIVYMPRSGIVGSKGTQGSTLKDTEFSFECICVHCYYQCVRVLIVPFDIISLVRVLILVEG